MLEDPKNSPCIHWVQREEGIFRILNTDWLARLWGRRHGNPRMTYEKMARAMRLAITIIIIIIIIMIGVGVSVDDY